MSLNITIRRALPQDAPTIVAYQIAMAAESENITLDEGTVTKGVARLFEEPDKGWYWVAEDENAQILGVLMTLREWSDWRNGSVLWIHSVYVRPDARKQGVYQTLYQHIQEVVQANEKLRGIRLYVDKTNQRAIKRYEALGMNGEHYQLYEWMKTF